MGAVDHLRATTPLPIWEDLQAIILKAKNQIQEQIEPTMFATAWNAGTVMTIDQMVNYAMERQEKVRRRERGSNPRYSYPYNGFRDRPIQPLWHLSLNLNI